MFESGETSMVSVVLVLMAQMLVSFNQGVALKGWLAPLKMAWLVPVLLLALNIGLKGSLPGVFVLPALVASYLLLGTLLLHTLVLYVLSQLPGQLATLTSAESVKAGGLLLRLSFVGLGILLKNILVLLGCLLAAILLSCPRQQLRLAGA
jgi:hypothetical protein